MKINYNDLVLNNHIDYYHNPFGGVDDEELLEVIDSRYSLKEFTDLLDDKESIIIQFVGKKGRGKTTHLRALHQLVPDANIYFLDRNGYRNITTTNNNTIFIDSIHHIPWRKRLQLWKQPGTSYVITTHRFRNLEFYLCKRLYKTFYFKGITTEKLERILKKRISQYSTLEQDEIIINPQILQLLIKQFGDDIRGLLNFLYDRFKIELYGY